MTVNRRTLLALMSAATAYPAAAAAQSEPVRVGAGLVEGQAQAYYAQDAGIFKKAGLNVEIQTMQSGAATASAVASGDIQFGASNVLTLGQAHLRGLPFTIVAPGALFDGAKATQFLVVARNSPITTAKELSGQIVAASSLHGLDQVVAESWIDKNGGDANAVKFIELPQPTMADALEGNRIQAAILQDPELTAAGNRIRVLGNAYASIAPVYFQSVWFTTTQITAQSADTAKRFSGAIREAGAWAASHQDQAAAILEKYTKVRTIRTTLRFGTALELNMIQPVLDAGAKYKILASPVAAADMVWQGK
jgi:NitT/TauT family transport system substrate-binding protein